jgi:phosphoribosylamine--glycine ligase
MADEEVPFTGFLYAGLVLTSSGPQVLEFNVRLGDPETQALLPRLESDLIEVLEGTAPVWSDLTSVNVVLAARGYPEDPVAGDVIKGLDGVGEDVLVFHGATRRDGKRLLVDGGRVLNLVGTGATLTQARERAYAAASAVSWPGMQLRTDIGRESQS